MKTPPTPETIACDVAACLSSATQIAPFTDSAELSLDTAYAAAKLLRAARGGAVIGRKIGFTNRGIWDRYGVAEPMWGDVFEQTLQALDSAETPLAPFAEPRLEPEIALGLGRAPEPGMSLEALARCVEWIAPCFEIVQSIYPGWRFQIADCAAAGALHGRLLLGPKRNADPESLAALPACAVALRKNGEMVERGVGANALDGPLQALKHLVDGLARDPHTPPLRAGERVSTGTLTDAWPIAPGEVWSAEYGAPFAASIEARFI